MVPSFANFGGKVHGGVILSLMDKVAYACASKHAGANCAKKSQLSINQLAFSTQEPMLIRSYTRLFRKQNGL